MTSTLPKVLEASNKILCKYHLLSGMTKEQIILNNGRGCTSIAHIETETIKKLAKICNRIEQSLGWQRRKQFLLCRRPLRNDMNSQA